MLLKNKKIIVIFIIIATMGIILYYGINYMKLKNIELSASENDMDVLVECSFSNFAWEPTYRGTIICNNGLIYTFNHRGSFDIRNLDELRYSSLSLKKVSDEDLILMKKYIKTLEYNYTTPKNTAVDMGTSVISVYREDLHLQEKENLSKLEKSIYVSNDSNTGRENLVLKKEGDWTGKNKSFFTNKLLDLINKYVKE